ncbi:hypothetical protein AB0J20_16200 [Micromonospora costi]|uniref:hypothetical protein n=1 Tax=Micromonospora costi TaxID=1530042 RepID=UPI0033D66698
MNIIAWTPFFVEERITTATGVERRISIEPVGHNRDHALKLFAERVTANPPAYSPHTNLRLVLIGGDR